VEDDVRGYSLVVLSNYAPPSDEKRGRWNTTHRHRREAPASPHFDDGRVDLARRRLVGLDLDPRAVR